MRTQRLLLIVLCSFLSLQLIGQTSWTGTVSTNWSTAGNWTAGVPTSTTDVIIGDASFTGSNQPAVNAAASCRSIVVGGTIATTLTLNRNLTVLGNFSINTNGTITHPKSTLSVTGNWINNGTYSAISNNTKTIFSGVSQTISGSSVTTFRKLTVNAGSTLTMNTGFTVSGSGSLLTVGGTINPGASTTFLVTASAITVNANGKLLVYASTFAGNYSTNPTLNAGSVVEYASSTIAQTVSNNLTYATLTISGNSVKTLAGNLPALNASSSAEGNILVNAGTLDLSTYTANRGSSVSGGTFRVYNGATLKIGGTNSFPANYATHILQLTSTVQYTGANQTISSDTYGNLQLSSSSGAVVKTMPATAFTIEGDFSSSIGSGTSVNYTAASNITVNGSFTIGSGTTFSGSTFSHTLNGNWSNNGTFTGATSTLTMGGANSVVSGTGIFNLNNFAITASGISSSVGTLTVAGNLSTSGSGQFTHSAGTLSMSGSSKTISGTDITFSTLSIPGTATTSTSFTITNNLVVAGSISASSGTITMTGAAKTISGAGTINLYNLLASGTISTASNFTINAVFDVTGSFMASGGTTTFAGTSSLNGTANLYNVILNGTSLNLSSNAVLGVANTFTITSGTLDVSSSVPNTVNYNGAAQNITATTYDNLILSNGNTKTAAGAIIVNRDISIAASTTFSSGSYTHQVKQNWINNGTFTPSTGTISLTGNLDGSITGATTFNILTLNKSASTNVVSLNHNVTASTVNMTTGNMRTNTNTMTITGSRTGNGIIIGNIQRTHSFSSGTAYAFEGPDNTITFSGVTAVTSVTVSVALGSISDFPFNASINRQYTISITGTYTLSTLRLHYEDAELNGNSEASMQLWKYNGTAWGASGKTTNSTTSNYVELSGLNNIAGRWTCSDNQNVTRWTGAVSSDWNTPGNWTTVQGAPSSVPSATDIVQIGTAAFTNNPVISTSAAAKNMVFGSTQAATLSLNSGGSLTVAGNISGTWSGNATHSIQANNQNITVAGNLSLSDGISNHAINLSVSSGTITVGGSVIQTGGANIIFSGAGALNIGGDFTSTSGTFTSATSTVTFNGVSLQSIAPVTYYNLTINKTAGIATINSTTSLNGDLQVTAGELNNFGTTSVAGNVSVATGAVLKDYSSLYLNGNWIINGTYTSSGSSVYFTGTSDQTISSSTINTIVINKASGIAILNGNVTITNNLTLTSGSFNLQTYTCDRSSSGGIFTMSPSTLLLAGGSNNFPANFSSYIVSATSTVHYNGSALQTVAGISYGHLQFSNGSGNAKTLNNAAIVNGDIIIHPGANFHSGGYTLQTYGNWTNNGTFTASTGTVTLQGSSKTITGNCVFNHLTVNGTYTVAGGNITYNGLLNVTASGSYNAGSGIATVNGDLTNSGSLTSSGTTTFSGTALQTLRLLNALTSTSTGIVNFNGSVSPVLNSTTSPSFATLNINNTSGVNPSIPWQVFGVMTVNPGGVFNGGISNHYLYGNFANNGTFTSTGKIFFTGTANKTVDFGSTGFTSTGLVAFSGSGAITVSGTPGNLNDVTISNTHSSGVTPSSNLVIGGDMVINSNSIFNASTYAHTIGGNLESNGTLNGGSSTFTMTSAAGELTGSANTTLHHLVISGSIAALADYKVTGNFTNNGTYDGSLAMLIMSGSSAATIGGTTTPSSISQLSIAKSSGIPVTMNVNISDVSLLYIQSGVLFTSTYSITQDAAGGFLIIDNGGTLRLGGTNSLPGFSGYGLDANSNVDYAGSTQSIGNAAIYGNLLITATGTKNAIVPFVTQGNFSLTSGTFTSSITVNHTIGGNWQMTGGTFNSTNMTITLNGTANQDISSTGAFNNLTINKASGQVTLSSAVTVNNNLNMTSGKIVLGSFNLTNNGSINNANSTNYIVATGAGSLKQTITGGGSKLFPIGSSAAYYPATIALTGASATDVFSARMMTIVYTGGTSGNVINTNIVNATWLLDEAVAGGSDASITVQWPQTAELSGFNRNFSRLAHYTSTMWEYGISDIAATGSNPYSVTRTGFTSFSPFAVSMFQALPVTWLSVSGRNENTVNHIYWSTAAEINNEYFSVERSADGIHYTEIGRIAGAVNSNTAQEYHFIDRSLNNPVYYYRIRQTDVDGRSSLSKTIVLSSRAISSDKFVFLGNPVTGTPVLSVQSKNGSSIHMIITDAAGRVVYSQRKTISPGSTTLALTGWNALPGTYLLTMVNAEGLKLSAPFVVQ